MTRVILALGSNLGDRAANLRAAVAALAEGGLRDARPSGTWETPPFPPGQPPFLNACLGGEFDGEPGDLLRLTQAIERALGRRPSARWGPRPCDIDILFFGDRLLATLDLEIPHPRIAERAFVLAPLSEVHRGPLPVLGETALSLLARVDANGIRRTAIELASSPTIQR